MSVKETLNIQMKALELLFVSYALQGGPCRLSVDEPLMGDNLNESYHVVP